MKYFSLIALSYLFLAVQVSWAKKSYMQESCESRGHKWTGKYCKEEKSGSNTFRTNRAMRRACEHGDGGTVKSRVVNGKTVFVCNKKGSSSTSDYNQKKEAENDSTEDESEEAREAKNEEERKAYNKKYVQEDEEEDDEDEE
ncbi:MAG: hypothetical protein HN509_17230 [Halobacteriovoraceae bacterium]|jgi:hypothetical protein|nr:hypothetical protein [Halobacteriovoraceae bacterium]MBT5094898.1 hypothetical protein [Halobacteriovoraceae bacterium]